MYFVVNVECKQCGDDGIKSTMFWEYLFSLPTSPFYKKQDSELVTRVSQYLPGATRQKCDFALTCLDHTAEIRRFFLFEVKTARIVKRTEGLQAIAQTKIYGGLHLKAVEHAQYIDVVIAFGTKIRPWRVSWHYAKNMAAYSPIWGPSSTDNTGFLDIGEPDGHSHFHNFFKQAWLQKPFAHIGQALALPRTTSTGPATRDKRDTKATSSLQASRAPNKGSIKMSVAPQIRSASKPSTSQPLRRSQEVHTYKKVQLTAEGDRWGIVGGPVNDMSVPKAQWREVDSFLVHDISV